MFGISVTHISQDINATLTENASGLQISISTTEFFYMISVLKLASPENN